MKKYNYKIEKPNMLEGFTEVEKGVIELEEIEDCPVSEQEEKKCDECGCTRFEFVSTACHGGTDGYDVEICSHCHIPYCPASECDGEECECKPKYNIKFNKSTVNWEPKTTGESLEEKFFREHDKQTRYYERCKVLAQIAKEHYQEHPEEIFPELSTDDLSCNEAWRISMDSFRDGRKGMVSIEAVLRVFDEGDKKLKHTVCSINGRELSVKIDLSEIRKAIEGLREKK